MQIIERALIDRIETATQQATEATHRSLLLGAAYEGFSGYRGGFYRESHLTDFEIAAVLRDEGVRA